MCTASTTTTVRNIQDLVTRLEHAESTETCSEACDKLLVELDSLQKNQVAKDSLIARDAHETGVRLWNLIVTKKTGKKINKLSIAQGRHVALHLTYFVTLNEQSRTASRKQQAMAMKCGKDWIGCDNISMAESCFVLSTECYIKLHRLMDEEDLKNHETTEEHLLESHSNMIQVYLMRTDLALRQSQHATAVEFILKAKELVSRFQLLTGYFCSSCYNFGLDCYEKESYEHSETFLRTAMDVAQIVNDVKIETSLVCQQLLAMVYMEMKNVDSYMKALEVLEQSILEHPETKSIHMKIKIKLLLNHDDESILRAFSDLSLHPSLGINLALETIGLFLLNKRFPVCYEALETLNRKYTKVYENVQVQLKKLEIMLSNDKISEAKTVIREELILLNNDGNVFEKDVLKQLQLLLWEQARNNFENENYEEALYWYDSSLQFMQKCFDDPINLCKLQGNRASCYFELKQYSQALEATEEAKKVDEKSIQVYFLLYKISLMMQNDDNAIDAITTLTKLHTESEAETMYGLVSLAAQLAFESGNRNVAGVVLERLLEISRSNVTKEQLIPIRCLTRLKFAYLSEKPSRDDIAKILNLIEKAHVVLKDLAPENLNEDEVQWFNKMAWNLALSCGEDYIGMEKSFLLCYEFSLLLSVDIQDGSQQRTCLLMAIGCTLQIVRELKEDQFKKEERLNTALSLIQKCCQVSENLDEEPQQPTMAFLVSYEFETKARLGKVQDLDKLLERCLDLPSGKMRTLEIFANVALNSREEVAVFGIKALKLAIKCHLEQDHLNVEALSKVVHSLINVSLRHTNRSNAECKEDAFNYFQDTLKIIENIKLEYPEMELVWLMTKAWNCGIYLYSAQHFDAAEKWCSLAMKFLKFLTDLKENYEAHMSSVFTEIISSIHQSRVQIQVEE